jgi:hypothetical protein
MLEASADNRRVVKYFVFVLISIVLLVASAQLMCRTPEQAERRIQQSEMLREHDAVCVAIPKPTDFTLLNKMDGGNSKTVRISYLFNSHLRAKEVQDYFLQNLPKTGWTVAIASVASPDDVKYTSFSKDNYRLTIALESVGSTSTRYLLDCARIIP